MTTPPAAWDPVRAASFFDAHGLDEWDRFENGRTPAASLAIHTELLRRYVRAGDRVLDAGAGPGRFTVELARLGADVVALDLSPTQLELNRDRTAEAGLGRRVLDHVVGDVTDLSRFADASFDATVCYGGPISYVAEHADAAVAELARVTRPGGHLLVSVMTLAGAIVHYLPLLLDLARRDGVARQDDIVATGILPEGDGYGHLRMRLFTWRALEELLAPHGEIVAASAAGLLPDPVDAPPELRDFVRRTDLALAEDPGVVGCGLHAIAVLEVGG